MTNQDLPSGAPPLGQPESSGTVPGAETNPAEMGGVSIAGGDVRVAGDIVGGNKVTVGTLVRLGGLRIFNIDVRLLPLVLVLLVVVGALVYYILRPTKPERMTGEFNVAVANFDVLDEAGKPINPEDGRKLGEFVYVRLEDSFHAIDLKHIRYQIWGPELTGSIRGNDVTERESSAKKLAEGIDAHIVIYGTIQKTRRGFELRPAFYVNYQGFPDANEITGEHQLGTALTVLLPFASNLIQDAENPALSARATALSLITIGFAYYSVDDHVKAGEFFSSALETEGWLDTAGKQVGYLLLGNARVRRASKDKTTLPLVEAENAYSRALEIEPAYARALVGLAGVTYLLALGDPQNPSLATADKSMLDKAEGEFRAALAPTDTPASANIPAKVHFGIAQIDFVRGATGDPNSLGKAKGGFEEVVAEFKAGNTSIGELAGHSYARLGLVARLQGDTLSAIENYKQAVHLVSPFYQGVYGACLGDVYLSIHQQDLAMIAYEDALHVAEASGDAESANKYRQKLNALKAGQ